MRCVSSAGASARDARLFVATAASSVTTTLVTTTTAQCQDRKGMCEVRGGARLPLVRTQHIENILIAAVDERCR
jgi:hypothetical protein